MSTPAARIAALKAGLRLTPAQEKNWSALETALRDVAKDRAARAIEWREKAQEHHGEARLDRGLPARRETPFGPGLPNWRKSRMRPSLFMTV